MKSGNNKNKKKNECSPAGFFRIIFWFYFRFRLNHQQKLPTVWQQELLLLLQ